MGRRSSRAAHGTTPWPGRGSRACLRMVGRSATPLGPNGTGGRGSRSRRPATPFDPDAAEAISSRPSRAGLPAKVVLDEITLVGSWCGPLPCSPPSPRRGARRPRRHGHIVLPAPRSCDGLRTRAATRRSRGPARALILFFVLTARHASIYSAVMHRVQVAPATSGRR